MKSLVIKYLFLLAILSTGINAYSGHVEATEHIYTPVGGTEVIIGQPEATKTVDLSPKTGSFTDYTLLNLITLGVDHHYPVYFPDSMQVRVKLHVEPYDASNSPLTDFYIYLDLNYNPFGELAYIDKNVYRFLGAYKFDYTIDSIYIDGVSKDTLPALLFIDGLIDAERYYDFATPALDSIELNPMDTFDLNCDAIMDELEISWPTVTEAEEYHLEWTFINDYDTSKTTFVDDGNLTYDFKNNSTRISTTSNSYRIPLLFDHGYIIFRVRAIGRDDSDPSKYIFGVWGLPDQGTVEDVSDSYFLVENPHEADKNWQASTTFAEEGKKKEVVSYFDGSLRNRQTVTRINSDNSTIVGETIYDHQGRPAVTILPVPVTSPDCDSSWAANPIMYYPLFNTDDTLNEYSRNDFDVDVDVCNTTAAPMDTAYGSSNYYSPANNNLSDYQRYVPDAKGYPFTQVEYTPDNTGRIRRQSGVGEDFQLESGHETKYYYGQPNQIQLDRMFGSEVGDATHYKKNLVIDPNGQASVSYLDQEGRVIATSLAGDSTNNLYAIDSEGDAAKELTIDLFAKDADSVSQLNKLNIQGNSIEFSTQLLVPFSSTYTFSYDIAVDTLSDSCLVEDVCFSCVYDLTIKVIDECGVDLIETEDTLIEKKVIGHFELVNDTIVFNAECSSPTDFDYSKSVELVLPVGNYTIIKKLTVNNDAIDFYVNSYLDSSINECFMTLHDFQSLYLSQIDTSDCYIDCEDCIEALGERDEYVAQGKGSAFDYDREYAECEKLCPQNISLCETAYQAMLMDMSPGGQYAHYIDSEGDVDPSGIRLSVLNTANTLPASYNLVYGGNWREPQIILNGNTYNYYLDEQNNRSTIPLVEDGLNYLPAVVDTSSSSVFQDTNGNYYTYPENLLNVSDFILYFWNSAWARSLVQYHPEYCYYETCIEYEDVVTPGDSYSSDAFDTLLMNTITFQDAIDNELIRADYDTVVNPNNRLENWFIDNTSNGKPWDPFVVRTSEYGAYATQMNFKFNFYTPGSTPFSMLEAASATVRCGNLINVAPTSTCMQFGSDAIPGGPSAYNDSIRDAEWNTLKTMYLSYKQILKSQRADNIALNDCESLNDCIGNDEFNPFASGLFTTSFPFGQVYNPGQPCSWYQAPYYATKVQRFPDPEDNAVSGMSANEIMYQQYLMTGQCPLLRTFQDLFGALAGSDSLTQDTVRLMNYPQYSAYYLAVFNYDPPYPITDFDLYSTGVVSVTEDTLSSYATFSDGSPATACPVRFIKNGTSFTNWNDIAFLTGIQPSGSSGGTFYYDVYAAIPTPDSIQPYRFDTLLITYCSDLNSCKFQKECDANDFALDIQDLMSVLALEGDLNGTEVDLQDSLYLPFSTPLIRAYLGTPNDELDWSWDISTHSWIIEDSTDATKRLRLYIRELDPPTFNLNNLDSITGFFGMVSTYEHYFSMYALYGVNNDTLRIDGGALLEDDPDTTRLPMGNCGLPNPTLCNETGHEVLDDLQSLVQYILYYDLYEDTINLYDNALFTPLLQSFLGDTTGITTSEYVHDYIVDGLDSTHVDTFRINMIGCDFEIWHDDDMSPELHFDDLVFVGEITTMGEPDFEGNFHDFYLPVTYAAGEANYNDTLYGSSCWPLKNCTPCPEEYEEEMMMMMMISEESISSPDSSNLGLFMSLVNIPVAASVDSELLDSMAVASGQAYYDNSTVHYLNYVVAIDSLNSNNGWTLSDSLYITALTYQQYMNGGFNYVYEEYMKFIDRYIYGVDEHQWLKKPGLFVRKNGVATNVKVQYNRYKKAEERYNDRADVNGLDAHDIKPTIDFYREKRASDIHSFIAYLETMPNIYGDPADDVDSYYGSMYSMMMLSNEDSCDTLYQLYLEAYMDFELYQDTNNTCFNYELVAPLYTQEDFENNNLCCSDTGFAVFNEYIEVFLDTLQCPGSLPYLSSCDSIITDDTTCLVLYQEYLAEIEYFNASEWADSMDFYLDSTLYPTYEMFLKTGRCDCAEDYFVYLDDYYTDPIDTTLANPQSIDEFCIYDLSSKTRCSELYYDYIEAVYAFNDWALIDPTWDTISVIYTIGNITPKTYCYCVEGYIAYLESVMEGVVPYNTANRNKLILGEYCGSSLTVECTPTAPILGNYVSPILTAYSNPCVEYLQNTALQNAQNAYDNYVDSLATEIRSRYIEHCLAGVENFAATYTDKEYHFTLYYYDQAGNLIKTVPPEGVQLLNITAPDDDTAILVNNDRTYGTRTIFTSHRMETRYEYNSLNQLVKQSMPDHDKMDIWETTLPNGLDSRLEGTEVTFTNESNGYMSGYITVNGTDRGMLYRTSDGGATWKKIDYTAGSDFKKIFWVNDTLAYGVGTSGIALKTIDGGNSWDVLNGYRNHHGVVDFNDLYFFNKDTGIFVGNSGVILQTLNGGVSFGLKSYPNKHASDVIMAVTGTNVANTVRLTIQRKTESDRPAYNVYYNAANWGGSSVQIGSRALDYQDIQYIDNNIAYAVGESGFFAKRLLSGSSYQWWHQNSNTRKDIKQIYFINEDDGISIQDSVSGYAQIYKTNDGGETWTLFSTPGQYYNYLYAYKKGTTHKVIVVGKNGLVSKIVLQAGQPFGIIPLITPDNSYDLNACWAYESSDGSTWVMVATGHTDGKIWFTNDGSQSIQSWTLKNSLSGGVKHIMMKQYVSGSDTTLSGTIIKSSDETLYPIFYNTSGTLSIGAFSPPISVGANFIDQCIDDAEDRVYQLDNGGNRVYAVSINGSAITTTATALNNTLFVSTTSCFDYSQTDTVYVGFSNGYIGYGKINQAVPSIAWTNEVTTVRPIRMNDTEYNVYRQAQYACGEGGSVYRDSLTLYRRVYTNITENLNSMKFTSTINGYVVGDNGKVYQMTINSIDQVTLTELYSPTTENLTDIAINGNVVYITGENGVLLYSPDITTTDLIQVNLNFTGNLNGVSFKPSSSLAYVVGDDSRMFIVSGATVIPQKNIFLPALRSVSFYDNQHGYILADNFNIRYTDDAGASWQPILPAANIGSSYPTFNKIKATDTNAGITVGNNRAYYTINDLTATITTNTNFGASSSNNIWDVYKHGSTIFAAIGGGGNGLLYQKVGAGSWSLVATYTGKPIRAIQGFSNGNILLACTAGKIVYYNDATDSSTDWTAPSGTTANDWKDIFFHDDLNGYIVGANGVVLRSQDFSLDANGYHVFGSWDKMQTDDDLNSQTDTTNMTINSIAFGERYNGIMCGSYSTTPLGYHRRIHDESQLYSTYFWYDKLGRIVLSQNTKQFNYEPKAYSYTIYDALGRVVEAGQKRDFSSSGSSSFSMIFGDTIATHYNPDVINDDSLLAWVNNTAGVRTEVTHSWYDVTDANIGTGLPGYFTQENLRKRIAHVTYEDTLDTDTTTYDHATHYTYDIHGNVKTLVQDNKKLENSVPALASQRFKRMDYSYDLISGNVHKVSYQKDSADAWHHAYAYDADNRITDVYTSNAPNALASMSSVESSGSVINEVVNNPVWDHDAKYFYYAHGPLARMETGDLNVQGTDYAYTLQGWIKGINSNTLDSLRDIGKDGDISALNPNRNFPKDVFGYSLNYFTGDYSPIDNTISGTSHFLASLTSSDVLSNSHDLYNGNIGSMVTTITNPTTREVLPLGNAYKYDQLHRLVQSKSFDNLNLSTNSFGSGGTTRYFNAFSYDANGNMMSAIAKDDAGNYLDFQTYNYQTISGNKINNRLYAIQDTAVDNSKYGLSDQLNFDNTYSTINSANNYRYDAIGNLIYNAQDSIIAISWTISNKPKEIYGAVGCSKKNIKFEYDGLDRRIAKHVYQSDSTWIYSEYYIRNEGGDLFATYRHSYDEVKETVSYLVIEQHMEGRGYLGLRKDTIEMIAASVDTSYFYRILGKKNYSMSNHLGNVLTVISDKKTPLDWDNNSLVDGYHSEILTSQDYAPFGGDMKGRDFRSSEYPNSFNGKRDDEELGDWQDYGERYYLKNARRFNSTDPISGKFPNLSTYQFASNNPIMNIDLDGLEGAQAILQKYEITKEEAALLKEKYDWAHSTGTLGKNAQFLTFSCNECSVGAKLFVIKPWRKITSTNNPPNPPVATGPFVPAPPITRNGTANLMSNQPTLTAADQAQLNGAINGLVPGAQVFNPVGAPTVTPGETRKFNSLDAPSGTKTPTTEQDFITTQRGTMTQIVNVQITVNLQTSMPNNPNAQALLANRFTNIQNYYVSLGVPAANITLAGTAFNQQGLPNNNQANITVTANNNQAPATQTTNNTTTTKATYEER